MTIQAAADHPARTYLLPTPEQDSLRAAARSFLLKQAPIDPSVIDNPPGWRPEIWPRVVDMGWLGIAVPERLGGSGMAQQDLAVVAEEAGASLVPAPLFSQSALVLPLACSLEDDELAGAVLSGAATAAVAWGGTGDLEALRDPGPSGLTVDGTGRLSGTAPFVVDGALADWFLVVVGAGDTTQVRKVAADQASISTTAVQHSDATRSVSRVVFSRAASMPVGPGDGAGPSLAYTTACARTWLVWESVGISRHLLAASVEHATSRQQFGRPIGTYQSISHRLASAYVDLELSRSLALLATHALDNSTPTDPAVDAAVLHAPAAAVAAGETAIQVLGGIGMTWESDVHRYLKRALVNGALLGPRASVRGRLGLAWSLDAGAEQGMLDGPG